MSNEDRLETCEHCGKQVQALIVSNYIQGWEADYDLVEQLGSDYGHLKEDLIFTDDNVVVCTHVCPSCTNLMGEPWIDDPRPSDCVNCASRDEEIEQLKSILRRWIEWSYAPSQMDVSRLQEDTESEIGEDGGS